MCSTRSRPPVGRSTSIRGRHARRTSTDKEIAATVKEKQAQDERKIAESVQRGTQTVAVRTGTDGGMHPTFLARLKPGNPWDGFSSQRKVVGAPPGDMGNNVNPPHEPATDDSGSASVRVASAPASEPATAQGESAWDRLTASVSRAFNRSPPSPHLQRRRLPACRRPNRNPSRRPPWRRPQGPPQSRSKWLPTVNRARSPRPRPLSPTAATAPASAAQVPSTSGSFESRWSGR